MKLITQAYLVAIISKFILIITIIAVRDSINTTKGTYNFIMLFGTIAFIIALAVEIKTNNFVTGLLAFTGLIIFQPLIPVFKISSYADNVTINTDLLDICSWFLVAGAIYDVIRVFKIEKLKIKFRFNSN